MSLTAAFKLIVDNFHRLLNVIDSPAFQLEFFGVRISLYSIFVAFVVLGFFASVWWRGARQ